MFAAILTSCTSALTGNRVSALVCLLLFVLNAFSFLHLSSISSVHALEEEEYSVASLLPSFKTLMFWRADRTTDENLPITDETSTLDHVSYQVSDVKPIDRLEESTELRADDVDRFSLESIRAEVEQKPKGFHFAKKRLIPNGKDNRICHSCGKNDFFLDEDEEYRQRIEYIKEQILTRLGMKRPPNLRSQPDIDYSMYMRIAENTINKRELTDLTGQSRSLDQDFAEEVDKAFILPSRSDQKTPVFDLSTVDTADHSKVIKSIYILVKYSLTDYYRTLQEDSRHHTDLNITAEPSENEIVRNPQNSTVCPMKSNHNSSDSNFDPADWYQYDVTELLSDFSGHMLRIHNENFDILSSVIMIEMTNNKLTRAKRSIDCTDKVSFCCRQHFYVNFTTIGWNNWIFQPPGYNANYCKGKCDLSHARYHHTTVIGKYPAIKLCCSPREMSSISLIYMDDRFNIYQKNLPNMVVESCDCA